MSFDFYELLKNIKILVSSQLMFNLKSCKNLEDLEMSRVIENLQIKHSTLGLHRESVANTNILKSPKLQKNAIFFQEFNNISKIIREIIFLKLKYVGQN